MQLKLLRGRLLLVAIHSLHQVTDLSQSVLFGLHPCPHHPKHLVVLHHHFQTIYNRSMLAFKVTTRRPTTKNFIFKSDPWQHTRSCHQGVPLPPPPPQHFIRLS